MTIPHQRLNFDEQRSGALYTWNDNRTTDAFRALVQEQGAWIRNWVKSRFPHFENTNFVGRPKTILHAPEYAKGLSSFPFKIEHRIHQVLEQSWPRNISIFGYMAYECNGHIATLGETEKLVRTLSYLTDASRHRAKLTAVDRLDGVHNHEGVVSF